MKMKRLLWSKLKELRLIALLSNLHFYSRSLKFKELFTHLSKRSENFSAPQKFDEVIYCCYSRNKVEKTFWNAEINTEDLYGTKVAGMVASDLPVGEIFFFDYGVTVIWGLEEDDEERILREIIPFEVNKLAADDIELETLKFFHDAGHSPRLFNDIICLKSGHYMVKLTISHAIAQSVKLTIYEELVESTIESTKHIPRMIAATGKVSLPRKRITKYIGKLFDMRMNVNLVSNVLDTPEIFWYETAFLDLYKTVRGYLEITQRADLLNQRCNVIGDLLVMLRDHINSTHAEMMEWVIIILICIEVVIGIFMIVLELKHK